MQQAIYTNINTTIKTSQAKATQIRKAGFLQHLALKWDLYGVVALIASCTAYGAFALAHVA